MRNPDWLREELILALELYFKLSFGQMDGRNSLVIALSDELKSLGLHKNIPDPTSFRSINSVSLKLANFKSFDPRRSGSGMEGSGLLDKLVWNEFFADQVGLVTEALHIRVKTAAQITSYQINEGNVGISEVDSDYSASGELPPVADDEYADPDPNAVLQSLRAFGYTLETAVADLIDNSITARATLIQITYGLDQDNSWLRIEDNGWGMSLPELQTAMKIGSLSPLLNRTSNDLGRFGLGLKTASFSQCRRLTVRSKQEQTNTRVWDLDYIHDKNKWLLRTQPVDATSETRAGSISSPSGTVVLWENLDRLLETGDLTKDKDNFYRKLEALKIHLGLIFHRFIEEDNLIIQIGRFPIAAFNPFNVSERIPSQELSQAIYTLGTGRVELQPYILPRESRLEPVEIKKMDVIRGCREHQGIYLYRNRRLILDGTWLDLNFRQKENQRLVRIQVDIPNTSDKEWQIDVKKAFAKVPDALRSNIERICREAIEKGIRVYTYRGSYQRPQEEDEQIYTWKVRRERGRRAYIVNDSHPIYQAICQFLGSNAKLFRDYMRIVAENLPVSMILNDFADTSTEMETDINGDSTLLGAIYENTLNMLIAAGSNREQAIETLSHTEIFRSLKR